MKFRLFLLTLGMLIPALLCAQTPDDYQRTVRTLDGDTAQVPSTAIKRSGYNPEMGHGKLTFGWEMLQVFTLRFSMSAGVATGKKSALYSTIGIGGFSDTFNGSMTLNSATTLNIMPNYRLYFGDRTMQGFYAGPFVRYKLISAERFGNPSTDPWGQPNFDGDLQRENYNVFAGGVMTGWQLLFKRFYFDTYFGLGMQTNSMTAQEEEELWRVFDQTNRGITYMLGISIGFGFQQDTKKAEKR